MIPNTRISHVVAALAVAALTLLATVPALAAPDERSRVVVRDRLAPSIFTLPSATYLGVHLTQLTPELRRHFGSAEDAGLLVGRVEEDSPADDAGLQVGDVLTHIDGEAVDRGSDVGRHIRRREAGDQVGLKILRNGRIQELQATVAESDSLPWIASLDSLESGIEFLPRIDLERLKNLQIDLPVIAMESLRGPEMDEILAKIQLELDRPEVRAKLDRLRSERSGLMDGHIRDLEKRLAELEAQLEALVEEGP